MLSAGQIEQYHQDGYLKGGRILADAEVDVLRGEIDRVIADRDRKDLVQPFLLHNMTGKSNAAVWQIVNIWEASAPFRTFD